MPRKSRDSQFSVLSGTLGQRLAPPDRLGPDLAEIWRSITAAKPVDWFTSENAPLLEALVHAIAAHRLISAQLIVFDSAKLAQPGGVAEYDTLTRMQERQARVMVSLATRLRLTPQSRYTPGAAATAAKKTRGARPWE